MNPAATPAAPYTPQDQALIPQLLPHLRLVRILVLSSDYFRDEILDQNPDMEMQIRIDNQITAYVHAESKQAFTHLDLAVIAVPSDPQLAEKVPLAIKARIEVRYEAKQTDMTPEDFEKAMKALCLTSSLSHGWSFFRQMVVDATSRMGIPPITIPLLINQAPVQPPSSRQSKTKKTAAFKTPKTKLGFNG